MYKIERLTEKEKEILMHVAMMESTREIARQMFLSEKTVENHRCNIKKKLELSDERLALVAYALKVKAHLESLLLQNKNEG